MIDFRYHLVSLVSVFIALAIGVVLGAGPLRGPLSDTLTSQVEALREDKANLQQAVTNRDNEITTQNTALQTLGADAVDGTLAGRRVLQVVEPGADPGDLIGYSTLLRDSGAEVVGTVTIKAGWSDPSADEARSQAISTLAAAGVDVGPTSQDDHTTLANLLAAAAVTTTPQSAPPANATAIWAELTAAELLTTTATDLAPADLVVVFAPGPSAGAAGTDTQWQAAEAAAGATLVDVLASASTGIVVSGPVSSTTGNGLLAELRSDSEATTVDGVNSVAAVGVVLGLLHQSSGGSGHYGSGTGATAVLPPLPTPAGTPSSTATGATTETP